MTESELQFKLCYVTGSWALFSSLEPTEAWGDDWNDAPYEYNAGWPYMDKGEWVRVAWDGQFDEPREGYFNSPYSVEHINSRVVPWLREWEPTGIKIWAGTTLADFIDAVHNAGGDVYLKMESPA